MPMVVRVEGIINGDKVIFEREAGDQWMATVPESLNGVYVVNLTAWDEAGNVAYYAKYILAYDPANLCASLIPCPYQAELVPDTWGAAAALSDYYAQLVPDAWQASVTLSDYYAELIEPAQCCCGR